MFVYNSWFVYDTWFETQFPSNKILPLLSVRSFSFSVHPFTVKWCHYTVPEIFCSFLSRLSHVLPLSVEEEFHSPLRRVSSIVIVNQNFLFVTYLTDLSREGLTRRLRSFVQVPEPTFCKWNPSYVVLEHRTRSLPTVYHRMNFLSLHLRTRKHHFCCPIPPSTLEDPYVFFCVTSSGHPSYPITNSWLRISLEVKEDCN